jgi:hypothetical protein
MANTQFRQINYTLSVLIDDIDIKDPVGITAWLWSCEMSSCV